jgi:hypothetical protein
VHAKTSFEGLPESLDVFWRVISDHERIEDGDDLSCSSCRASTSFLTRVGTMNPIEDENENEDDLSHGS